MNDVDENEFEEFESYLMDDERPLKAFKISSNKILLTTERLIALKKFPKSFTSAFYKDILNVDHHTYILWGKFFKSILLFAAAVYGYYNPYWMQMFLYFLEENVPELTDLVKVIDPIQAMQVLVALLTLLGIHQLIIFLLSLTGRLRISVKGGPSIRIRTRITPEVRELIKIVEEIKKHGVQEVLMEPEVEEDVELQEGRTYIFREYRPRKSREAFFKEVQSDDMQGLFISRANPDEIARQHDAINVNFMWLTDSITESDAIRPEPEQLFALITDFLERNQKGQTVVFLDGIEYLITHSSFEQTLHLIQGMVDKIGVHSSRLIIPLSPGALSRREQALLEREVTAVI